LTRLLEKQSTTIQIKNEPIKKKEKKKKKEEKKERKGGGGGGKGKETVQF